MIKILREEILNAIYVYWFHSDTWEEKNSPNGHSNGPSMNGQRFVISPVKWNLLDETKIDLSTKQVKLVFFIRLDQNCTLTIYKNRIFCYYRRIIFALHLKISEKI